MQPDLRRKVSTVHIEMSEDDRQRSEVSKAIRAELAQKIALFVDGEGERAVVQLPGLNFVRRTTLTQPTAYLYEPSLAMIVQGRKRVVLGEATYIYDESRFLVTSVNLPTITQVLEASPEVPYLSLLMRLDLNVARQLMADIDLHDSDSSPTGTGMATGPATVELFDAFMRLANLLDTPKDLAHLGGLIQREILYRILTSSAGARLRQTVMIGTHSHRLAKAIDWLRENFKRPLRIEELAQAAGMGVSTLHHHFRALTAMSPLQYQKYLRLHEARRLLLVEDVDAGTAALRVGYESATQFSREYRRQFGAPPIRDIQTLRANSPNQEMLRV